MCEEIALLLRTRFGERFHIAEQTLVQMIDYTTSLPTVHIHQHDGISRQRTATDIILCTNGYKHITLRSHDHTL